MERCNALLGWAALIGWYRLISTSATQKSLECWFKFSFWTLYLFSKIRYIVRSTNGLHLACKCRPRMIVPMTPENDAKASGIPSTTRNNAWILSKKKIPYPNRIYFPRPSTLLRDVHTATRLPHWPDAGLTGPHFYELSSSTHKFMPML